MFDIDQETVAALGFDLDEAVKAFAKAVDDHRLTVNVPAPTAHPLVEQIVRYHGSEYQIIEQETGLPPEDPNSLTSRLTKLEVKNAQLMARIADLEAVVRHNKSETKDGSEGVQSDEGVRTVEVQSK